MIVVREVVTLLRYQVDQSGLLAYRQAFESTLQAMAGASVRAGAAMRQALADVLPGVANTPQAKAGPSASARMPGALMTIAQMAVAQMTVGRMTVGQMASQRTANGQTANGQTANGQTASASVGPRPQSTPAARQHAGALGGLRGVIQLTLGASPFKRVLGDIDAWVQIQARLLQAAGSEGNAGQADRDLARVSRTSGTPYADNVDTYARSALTLQDHGRTRQEATGITEAVALSMRLSQTPAQNRDGIVTALTNMVEQGRLDLGQFNTLPQRMQDALATGLNLSRGQLRDQVQGGQVTTDRALPALQSQLPAMRTEAEAAPASITAAMTVFNDAMQRYLGQALPAGHGVLNGVATSILFLADHIDAVVKLLALTGASIGLVSLGNGLRRARAVAGGLFQSLTAATRAALGLDAAMAMRSGPAGAMQMLSVWTRSIAPMLRMAAVLTTIYLIGEDIANWMAGGESVLGGWIGGVEEWQDELDAVSSVLTFVKDLLGGAGEALGPWIQRFGSIAVMVYGLWQILSPVGGFLLNLARVVVPMLWNAFAMTPIGRIISLIGMLAVALWQIWENWDAIKAYISASWDALMAMAMDSFLGPVIEYIRAIWKFWSGLVSGVIAAFTGDWDGAIAHWAGAFNGLWTFFSDMGGRMVATVKEIGRAIQTWVIDKARAAKDWLKSLLPGQSGPDAGDQASVMDGWSPDAAPNWLTTASGAAGLVVPPVSVIGPVPMRGGAPFSFQSSNNFVVNVASGDPLVVKKAVADAVSQGQQRGLQSLPHWYDLTPGVESPG
ncbi:MAG: tape measure protein [Achromobacter sp.]|uniref:tape measure protein n=1 Tax=Achromobacter sp. TaxID=134375 RepID=UPI0029AAA0E6|nr:tape measure protein [Achromobacter sp.]MDX3986245.1 tape measure protein [Achromobacter sp.]